MIPPLIKRLVYCIYINTYVYVGMLENTTYITHWQFLPSIDIMEPTTTTHLPTRKNSGLLVQRGGI
jgi:hypothetical protein